MGSPFLRTAFAQTPRRRYDAFRAAESHTWVETIAEGPPPSWPGRLLPRMDTGDGIPRFHRGQVRRAFLDSLR